MTALEQYSRLEAEARYFDGASATANPVMLGFGERSLVIFDFDDMVIAHWPLGALRALGNPGDGTVQLVPHLTSDERVVLSDADMIAAITAVCPDLFTRPVSRKSVRRTTVWGLGALASVALILLILIPALSDRLAEYIPPDRERALGDAVAVQIGSLLGLETDEALATCEAGEGPAALARMVSRVAGDVDLPYPLRVSVIDHPLINAVALPGGRILIFRGLIDAAEAPEEVAGVLAHEIGHVIHRHPTRGVLRAAGTAGIVGILLGDVFGGTVLVAASDAVLNASHQREAETVSDEVAYDLLARAGLPSQPFSTFFERLHMEHGDQDGFLRYVASHPGLQGRAERAAAADTIGDGAFDPVLSDRDWLVLQNICS